MEYLEIKNNIVIGHYCGELPEQTNPEIEYKVVTGCAVNIGDDIRIYENIETGIKKTLAQLINEELITIPNGKKLNEAGTDFVDLTDAEKVSTGIISLKPDEKIDGDYIVKKTKKELYEESLITATEYNAYIDELREAAYRQEADPLGMQVLRGDIDREVWLAKIEEIKKRFPKVTE